MSFRIRFLAAALLPAIAAACVASTQKELQLGQSYSQQINAQLPLVSDPEINRYLTRLGDSLARVADTRDLEWHFFLVDSREINAFAVPGGYIYVNRGLVEKMKTMNELAAAVGHEIAHVTQRHSVKQMASQERANYGLTAACVLTRLCGNQAVGAAVNLGASATFAKFSRGDEAEADRFGLEYIVRAGIDPNGMTETFRVLLAERARKPEGTEAFFTTHPLEEDRIRQAEEIIMAYPQERIRGLTVDTKGYQDFRRRVLALPPSPAK
jgi:predicted Zn-dependent protease